MQVFIAEASGAQPRGPMTHWGIFGNIWTYFLVATTLEGASSAT